MASAKHKTATADGAHQAEASRHPDRLDGGMKQQQRSNVKV